MAQFYREKWPTKSVAVLLCFRFLLSRSLCLFPLVSPYFLVFHDILEPQNSPPNEVTGFVYRFSCRHYLAQLGLATGSAMIRSPSSQVKQYSERDEDNEFS